MSKFIRRSETTGRSEIIRGILIALVCLLLPLAAWYSESTSAILSSGSVDREEAGGDSQEYQLILNAEGLPEDYDYTLSVDAALLTDEEIAACLAEAREEIEKDFYRDGETADHATEGVNPLDSYADGLVTAEWSFSDYDYIDTEGNFLEESLPEEGILLEAEVTLTCQEQSDIYDFTFSAYPKELSEAEALLKAIQKALEQEGSKAGTTSFILPTEVNGVKLNWSSGKQYLAVKVLVFEIIILILLYFLRRERQKEALEERKRAMERDYSEIVSKLSILMGAGMSLKSAWKMMIDRYELDLRNGGSSRPAYEEMAFTLHQMESGVTENIAYQKFGERTGVHSFLRLSRLLLQNQQKGSRNLCGILEKESVNAFDERKLQAKKQGEEAGTKMLLPMMIMMGIVIAIVIAPALVSFGV